MSVLFPKKTEVNKYYVGRASKDRAAGFLFISQGGKHWTRLLNRSSHIYRHAMNKTNGVIQKLEQGEYVTFKTSCTACHKESGGESISRYPLHK